MPVKDRGGKGKPAQFYSCAVTFWMACHEVKIKLGYIPIDLPLEWQRDWLEYDLEKLQPGSNTKLNN
jgi:hypothetical protein